MTKQPTNYEAACGCARAQMTRSASLLERAKDEPEQFNHWYSLSLRADELASVWVAEAERLKKLLSE